MPTELVLHNRAVVGAKHTGPFLIATTIVLLLGMMLVLSMIAARDKPTNWFALVEQLRSAFASNPWRVIEPVIVALMMPTVLVYLARANKYERLVLSELGIRYTSPLPAALQFLNPSWSLSWNQIRHVELKPNRYVPATPHLTLVLDAGTFKRSIRPYHWIDSATYRPPSWRRDFQLGTKKQEEQIAEITTGPIVQFIRKIPHLKLEIGTLNNLTPFALEKNPAALGTAVFFLLCLVYAFADTFIFNGEAYVDKPLYEAYVAGGVALSVLALLLMRRASVPLPETLTIAILAGAAFGAALYPGLLRINQLTDREGLIAHEYKMVKPASFVPLKPELPAIKFPERHVFFWSSHTLGQIETFRLRKGGLGFYQIDMAPIYKRIDNFYEARNAK
jgi:hypothetical protein